MLLVPVTSVGKVGLCLGDTRMFGQRDAMEYIMAKMSANPLKTFAFRIVSYVSNITRERYRAPQKTRLTALVYITASLSTMFRFVSRNKGPHRRQSMTQISTLGSSPNRAAIKGKQRDTALEGLWAAKITTILVRRQQ